MRKSIIMVMVGMLALSLTGCGSSKATTYEATECAEATGLYEGDYDNGMMEECSVEAMADNDGGMLYDNRKLIKTVNLDVETEEYDALLPNIEVKVNQLGGYIENYTTSGRDMNRYANMTARIPADKLDQFVDIVGQSSNIVYRNEYVEDVTLSYVDLQSHKDMLRAEQDRLIEFMERAETMEDIITLESRLTDVRYELESMEAQLRTYDNQITYSTVVISVSEVEKFTPPTQMSAGEKMFTGFMNNVERIVKGIRALGIGIVINLPFLFLFAIIVLIIVVMIKIVLILCRKKATKPQIPQDKK